MDGNEAAGRRILVVEDDEDTRLVLGRLLEREGYTVAEAADGRRRSKRRVAGART